MGEWHVSDAEQQMASDMLSSLSVSDSWQKEVDALRKERALLIKVLKEARLSIALEDERLEEGVMVLGMWTPLNCLREVVAKCVDIKIKDEK